jgi:hypothetical protein
MVVGLTTTYAISNVELESHSGEVYSIQHYVIKFVNEWRHVSGFFKVLPVSSTNKSDGQDITEILLKVAIKTLNIILKGSSLPAK